MAVPSRLEPAPSLTLDEVASELGVHYMTVYRYVRQGRLQATRVHGVWQVSSRALDEFRADKERAKKRRSAGRKPDGHKPDGQTSASDRSKMSADARRSGNYVAELERCLVAGDGRGASDVLDRAIDAGADVDEAYVDILSPALASIGDRWARGELDIAIEHQATAIATRLVGQLSPRFSRPGRRRGVLVLGGPSGERHGLVLAMLADLLRREGWDVHDLGPDTPPQSFVHAANAVDELVAIGFSVSSDENLDSARDTLAHVRAELGPRVRLVVGGHAIRDAETARSLGADHWASGAREFADYLNLVRAS